MSYSFGLKENIFMQYHLLTVTNGQKSYESVIESSVNDRWTFLIWLNNFKPPLDEIDNFKAELTEWLAAQNIKCIFYNGNVW